MKTSASLLALFVLLCLSDFAVGLKKFCKNDKRWQPISELIGSIIRPGRPGSNGFQRPPGGGCPFANKGGNGQQGGLGDRSRGPSPGSNNFGDIFGMLNDMFGGRKQRDVASASSDVTDSVEFLIRKSGGDPSAIDDGTELIVVVDDDSAGTVAESVVPLVQTGTENAGEAEDAAVATKETRTKRDVAKKIFRTDGIASEEENSDQQIMVLFAAPEDIIKAHFPPNVDFKELHDQANDGKMFDSPSENEELLYENFLKDLNKDV